MNPFASTFSPSDSISLPSIKETAPCTHPRVTWWDEQPLSPSDNVRKSKNVLYIATEITYFAIKNHQLVEYFCNPEALAYYLRFQCKKQVLDGHCKVFKSRVDGHELVIFNAELHSAHHHYVLYIIASPNNYKSKLKWRMDGFMTAPQIHETFGINCGDLPHGSRLALSQKAHKMMKNVTDDLQRQFNSMSPRTHNNLMHLGQIKSRKKGSYPMNFSPFQMAQCIQDAIEENVLFPILWFHKRKPSYHIQMLLPVRVAQGHWIGLTFDYEER
eukprot:372327_1